MRTLIIGCGKIGIPLGLKLSEEGHHVTGLRRNIKEIPSPITPFYHDLNKDLLDTFFLQSFELIFIILTPSERDKSNYENTYEKVVPAISRILQESSSQQRIIFTSSSHVYSENKGQWVNEKTLVKAYDYRSKALIAAEKSILELNNQQSVVCRFSGLYDKKSTYMQKQIAAGKAIKTPLAYTNRLHRDDAIGFLYYLGTQIINPEKIYLVSDSNPMLRKEVFLNVAKDPSKLIFEEQNCIEGKRCDNKKMLSTGYPLKYPSYLFS